MKTKKTVELFTKKTSDYVSSNYICIDQNETIINSVKKAAEQNKETILVKNEKYKTYDIVCCGHSLGGGTTVLLSLMMKYGKFDNLKYFINKGMSSVLDEREVSSIGITFNL